MRRAAGVWVVCEHRPRSNHDIVLKGGQRSYVAVRSDADAIANYAATIDDRVRADYKGVPDDIVFMDDHVVARIETITNHVACVNHYATPDDRIAADPQRGRGRLGGRNNPEPRVGIYASATAKDHRIGNFPNIPSPAITAPWDVEAVEDVEDARRTVLFFRSSLSHESPPNARDGSDA
jgi:hypothetical protein